MSSQSEAVGYFLKYCFSITIALCNISTVISRGLTFSSEFVKNQESICLDIVFVCMILRNPEVRFLKLMPWRH